MSQTSGRFSTIEKALSAQLDGVLALASGVDAGLVVSLREAALSLIHEEKERAESNAAEGFGTLVAGIRSRFVPGTFRQWTFALRQRQEKRLHYFQMQEEAVRSASPEELMWNLEVYQKARSEHPYSSIGVHFEFRKFEPVIRLKRVAKDTTGDHHEEGSNGSTNGRE